MCKGETKMTTHTCKEENSKKGTAHGRKHGSTHMGKKGTAWAGNELNCGWNNEEHMCVQVWQLVHVEMMTRWQHTHMGMQGNTRHGQQEIRKWRMKMWKWWLHGHTHTCKEALSTILHTCAAATLHHYLTFLPQEHWDNIIQGMCKRETWTANKFVKTACAD